MSSTPRPGQIPTTSTRSRASSGPADGRWRICGPRGLPASQQRPTPPQRPCCRVRDEPQHHGWVVGIRNDDQLPGHAAVLAVRVVDHRDLLGCDAEEAGDEPIAECRDGEWVISAVTAAANAVDAARGSPWAHSRSDCSRPLNDAKCIVTDPVARCRWVRCRGTGRPARRGTRPPSRVKLNISPTSGRVPPTSLITLTSHPAVCCLASAGALRGSPAEQFDRFLV